LNSTHVPAITMGLGMQTQTFKDCSNPWNSCPDSSTPAHVNMQIDWVAIYEPTAEKLKGTVH